MKELLRQVLDRIAPRLGLTPDAVDVLVGAGGTRHVRTDRPLCPQGCADDLAVLVLDGAGRVECAAPGDGVVVAQIVPPGQFARLPTGRGPGSPAPGFRAVAHVDSWVGLIGAASMAAALDRLSGDRALRVMAYGWRAFSGHLYERCRLPVLRLPDRLLVQLGILAHDFGHPVGWGTRIELRVTHAQLAGLVGASRPAVCRALRALTSRGSVALDGYRFVLVDPRVAMNGR